MPLHPSAVARAIQTFAARFGLAPRWLVTAPGRVNLIGEHTDYNDGFVLPMALDRVTAIAAGPADGRMAMLYSRMADESVAIALDEAIGRGEPQWTNYVRGVIAGAIERGMRPRPFRAVIESDVPLGGGLSSSAALEVSVATLLQAVTGQHIDPVAKARLCQRAERDFAGVPTGIMDQLTAVMGKEGHTLLIDCRSTSVRHVPLSDASVVVLIINTNVRHDLADGEYAVRRRQCEEAARLLGVIALRDATAADLDAAAGRLGPLLFRRARHVVSENDRTLAAAEALAVRDWPRMGSLMYASHDSLARDYEVSCEELDLVVGLARDIGMAGGVFGARMTGGGFGGSVVSLVAADAAKDISGHIAMKYQGVTSRAAGIFSSRPGGPSCALPLDRD